MNSVQQALDAYLGHAQMPPDFRGWCCETPLCRDSGHAYDDPTGVTHIHSWPQVLLLTFNRWQTERDVLEREVFCDDVLESNGHRYRLQSLVTHVGRTAASGHYIAYARHGAKFLKLNDRVVSILNPKLVGDFVSLPNEKVYILYYVHIPAERPPAEAVSLEGSSDSDVIVTVEPTSSLFQHQKRSSTQKETTRSVRPRNAHQASHDSDVHLKMSPAKQVPEVQTSDAAMQENDTMNVRPRTTDGDMRQAIQNSNVDLKNSPAKQVPGLQASKTATRRPQSQSRVLLGAAGQCLASQLRSGQRSPGM